MKLSDLKQEIDYYLDDGDFEIVESIAANAPSARYELMEVENNNFQRAIILVRMPFDVETNV